MSRLDRVYSNHHGMEQLDKSFACVALPRCRLSHHKPISFSCILNHRSAELDPILNPHVLRHPHWAKRVAAELEVLEQGEDNRENPLRRLVLCKRAMKTVTRNMQQEKVSARAVNNEDKLCCNCKTTRRKFSAMRIGSPVMGTALVSLNTPKSIPALKCLPVLEITMTRASPAASIS